MTTTSKEVTIYSEEGDNRYPNKMTIKMDDSSISCPVTFWIKGKAVFSMSSDEISAFIKVLTTMDCTR